MQLPSHRGRTLATLATVGAVGLLAVPIGAHAGTEVWRSGGSLAAYARDAGPSHDNYAASAASADSGSHLIRAGAHYPGGWTQYAGFAEGWAYACHTYNATQTLGPLIENPHSVTQDPVGGGSAWGADSC